MQDPHEGGWRDVFVWCVALAVLMTLASWAGGWQ